jgi:hypothetical protein
MSPKTDYSGQFVLRIRPELHRRLVREARSRGLSLNAHCALLLQGEPPASDPQLTNALSELRKLYEPQGLIGVVLFGSRARQEARADSDYDLFLIFEPATQIRRELYRKWEQAALHHPAVSIHASALLEASSTPPGIWLEVAWDGQVLWEKDPRVSQRLHLLKERIARGDYRRKTAHGQGYWIQGGTR